MPLPTFPFEIYLSASVINDDGPVPIAPRHSEDLSLEISCFHTPEVEFTLPTFNQKSPFKGNANYVEHPFFCMSQRKDKEIYGIALPMLEGVLTYARRQSWKLLAEFKTLLGITEETHYLSIFPKCSPPQTPTTKNRRTLTVLPVFLLPFIFEIARDKVKALNNGLWICMELYSAMQVSLSNEPNATLQLHWKQLGHNITAVSSMVKYSFWELQEECDAIRDKNGQLEDLIKECMEGLELFRSEKADKLGALLVDKEFRSVYNKLEENKKELEDQTKYLIELSKKVALIERNIEASNQKVNVVAKKDTRGRKNSIPRHIDIEDLEIKDTGGVPVSGSNKKIKR